MADIKAELIAALLECETISRFDYREALIRQLPDNIRHNLKTTTSARIDVVEFAEDVRGNERSAATPVVGTPDLGTRHGLTLQPGA